MNPFCGEKCVSDHLRTTKMRCCALGCRKIFVGVDGVQHEMSKMWFCSREHLLLQHFAPGKDDGWEGVSIFGQHANMWALHPREFYVHWDRARAKFAVTISRACVCLWLFMLVKTCKTFSI